MSVRHKIVIFNGDYCGPEVMKEGIKVLQEIERQAHSVSFELVYHLIGGAAWDVHKENITQDALQDAISASAVLLGAVGGPNWKDNAIPVEWGLGTLRKNMGAFGNLRPVMLAAPCLSKHSALKADRCHNTNILIVRELTGGIYFGERQEHDGSYNTASDVDQYSRHEVERVARLAGVLARSQEPKCPVTSVDKANVLAAAGRLWRGVVSEVMEKEFPDLTLKHLLVDTAAMQLVMRPTSLNGVLLTSNMFGDILSDEAAGVMGSIGLLPSASLTGVPTEAHPMVQGLYEPVHGSAPDLAGTGTVNPIGMILSVAMMCKYSLGLSHAASAIHDAVRQTLEADVCTPDLGGCSTTFQVGETVLKYLREMKIEE